MPLVIKQLSTGAGAALLPTPKASPKAKGEWTQHATTGGSNGVPHGHTDVEASIDGPGVPYGRVGTDDEDSTAKPMAAKRKPKAACKASGGGGQRICSRVKKQGMGR